jgi:hypothetical protein
LCSALIRAFAIWAADTFGDEGMCLTLAAKSAIPNLRALWTRVRGEEVALEPVDAVDEYLADLANEASAEAAKSGGDCANIARTLVGAALKFMQPLGDAAAMNADAAIDIYAFLPTTHFAQADLTVSSNRTDQQRLNYALLCCARTNDGERQMRAGREERAAFLALAQSGVSPAVLSAIPADQHFKKSLPIPKSDNDLVDAAVYGLVPGLTAAHLVATFLRRTNVLASEAAANFQQQGRSALTVSAEMVAFARQQASSRHERLGNEHPAFAFVEPVAPTHVYPSALSATMLEQDVLVRLARQRLAAVTADSDLLKSAQPVLALLRLRPEQWAMAAKVRTSAGGLVFGSAPACLKFQSAVPALQDHVDAVTAEFSAIQASCGGGSSVADAIAVIPKIRALIVAQYEAAKSALAALVPDEDAGAQAHAAFATRNAAVLAFLDKLVRPALRSPTAERVPNLATAAATISMSRLLELYEGVMGYHSIQNDKVKLLSEQDKRLLEYAPSKDVHSPGELRRRLLAHFLSRDNLAKVYANDWSPTSVHFTGRQLNVRASRSKSVAAPLTPVKDVTFLDVKFTRDNVDTLGSVIIGKGLDGSDQEFWYTVGDVLLSLLFGRVVGPASGDGFVVQQRTLTPLLDRMFNTARPEHAANFAWLILRLRELDPSRFCCGLDPGKVFCGGFFIQKYPLIFCLFLS